MTENEMRALRLTMDTEVERARKRMEEARIMLDATIKMRDAMDKVIRNTMGKEGM